jgi:hypothetical protein
MKKYLALVLTLASFAATAIADSQSGKVAGFGAGTYNGKETFVFKLAGNPSGGCNSTGRYVLDPLAPSYKTTVASIIAACRASRQLGQNG